MEPGLYKRVRFRNELSAVTTIDPRKSPVTTSATPGVASGTTSALCVGSFKFTWIVENFSWMTEETPLIGPSAGLDFHSAVKSPLFLTGGTRGLSSHHWALLLHPAVSQYDLQNPRYGRSSCVGVHLQLQRPSEEISHVDFTISLLNARGERIYFLEKSVGVCNGYLGEAKSFYQAETSGSLGGCSGWPDFISRQTLMRAGKTFLADNKLTIRCDMLISYNSAMRSDVASNPSSLKNGRDSVSDLLNTGMYQFRRYECFDVYLRCEKAKYGAHKHVLAARSTVLKGLFESQPAEDYDMFDVSDLAMEVVLDFIYGADVENSLTRELCRDVYSAARKFALPDLMHRCTKILANDIKVRSFCELACLAHLHGDEELFDGVKRFVKANASKVLASPEWIKFVQRRPELAVQLV